MVMTLSRVAGSPQPPDAPSARPRPRLAVIGSGISGLAAGWLLRERFEVTLFERHAAAGMGAVGIDHRHAGITQRVDVPARVIAPSYYPHLVKLLGMAGVGLQSANHSGAYFDEAGDVFFHYGQANLAGRAVFYPKNLRTLSRAGRALTVDSMAFLWNARRQLQRRRDQLAGMSLGDYLDSEIASGRVGRACVDRVLLPALSLVGTCDYASVRAYPADMPLDLLASGVVFDRLMRAEKGVDDIVSRLLSGVRLVCGVSVRTIERTGDGLDVLLDDGRRHGFDQVIVATEAPQAARMLESFPLQRALLEQVSVERSTVTVHTDASLMPRSLLPLSPVTYRLERGAVRPEVTVDLRKSFPGFQGTQSVFQTWSPQRQAAPEHRLMEASFTRPVVTHGSREAMRRLRAMQARETGGLWICGAYVGDRIPVLEAAAASAMELAERLAA